MREEPAIEVRHLKYFYSGRAALSDVSFAVARGAIHGFVGPNGAGKTTMLKIIATLLRSWRGDVRVFGRDVNKDQQIVRRAIGFMPEHFSTYLRMTVLEYLDFFGAAYGFGESERDEVTAAVLALTELDASRMEVIGELSRGMQQRVSLARTLIHDPDLLLLDEPASGLDPRARVELMEILLELRGQGKTIFISSHILSELATLCDEVTVLDRGLVKYSGAMRDLTVRNQSSLNFSLTLAEVHPATEAALRALAGVASVKWIAPSPRYEIAFEKGALTPNTILRAVLESGGEVVSFQEDMKQLNEAFMDLTRPEAPT